MKLSPIIPRSFYRRHPEKVARELLGCYLVRKYKGELLAGKIVETEAYLSTPDDPASHGFKPKSRRTNSLFGDAGYAYVTNVHRYMIMNVVTETHDMPSGVLIRAIEPIHGVETMQKLRGKDSSENLTNGPGKLTLGLNITRKLDGIDITDSESEIFFTKRNKRFTETVITSPRIGISKAQEFHLRFYIKNNPYVSK